MKRLLLLSLVSVFAAEDSGPSAMRRDRNWRGRGWLRRLR